MPKYKQPSRSLFAALPPDLKRSIRLQAEGAQAFSTNAEVEQLRLKRELVEASLRTQFLPTQPISPVTSSSSSVRDTAIAVVQDAQDLEMDVESTEPAVPIAATSSSVVLKRFAAPRLPSPKAIRKGKGKAENLYASHPWDCTGLVPRYRKPNKVPPDIVKYWYQRHLLLPLYDELPLLLDHTGWFSITPKPIAAQIAERCRCDVIVDAFCGVGGNAIEFAKTCERVIAIDNNLTRLRIARHNALHLGVANRIEFIHGDFIDFAKSYKGKEAIDVVFLSPPWGGIDYLNFATPGQPVTSPGQGKYSLSSILPIHGAELFRLCKRLTPNIAYYLPRKSDIQELSDLAEELGEPDMYEGRRRDKEWVEIEEEWFGDKLKAITAYFGGLVAE